MVFQPLIRYGPGTKKSCPDVLCVRSYVAAFRVPRRGKKAADAGQPKTDGVSLAYANGAPEPNAIVTETASDLNAMPLKLPGRLAWNEERTVQVFTPFARCVVRIFAQPGKRA